MFFSNDDDDADFTPREGSKLASLFGMDKASSQGGNKSLKYHPPKEPKKDASGSASSSASNQLSVLHAVPVHAFKLSDGKYTSQGKLGMAIIGHHATREYKVLLYLTKTQQVTHAVVTQDFKFTIQPNNYATFYDYSNQNWSVMFETESQLTQFAKQLAVAKANHAGPSLDTVIIQDLVNGTGLGLEPGDSVELMYTGWILTDFQIGKMFESNANAEKLLRFKVGKGKVGKGLDLGVVGIKKDGVRLVVVPPQLAFGSDSKGSIPPSSTLIYEVKAVRVKLSKEKDTCDTAESSMESQPESSISGSSAASQAEPITTNAKSDGLAQSSTRPNKAKLISRIAKMGQAMFPVTEPASLSPSPSPSRAGSEQETEGGDMASDPSSPKPAIPNKPTVPSTGHSMPQPTPVVTAPIQMMPGYPGIHHQGMSVGADANQLALYQTPVHMVAQNYAQPTFGSLPEPAYVHSTPVPPVSMATDSSVTMLLSETRSQTTEMRMSLSKVADKVDMIYDKLSQIHQSQQQASLATVSMATNMDASVLLHNIQRIVQENERLKKEVLEKNEKIEKQNERISDLLNKSHRFLEQSNTLLEQKNDTFKATTEQSQARLLALEKDKMQLTGELNSLTSQFSALQLECSHLNKHNSDLQLELNSVRNDLKEKVKLLEEIKIKYTKADTECQRLTEQRREDKQEREQLEVELLTLKNEMADLKMSKEKTKQSQSETEDELAKTNAELEEQLKDAKKQYEEEIAKLKEKLNTASSEKNKRKVETLNKEWQRKCDDLLADTEVRHQRALAEVKSKNEQLEKETEIIQQKYENLRSQAAVMRQRYEDRISELEGQQGAAPVNEATKQQMIAKVKQIMNLVYHEIKEHFEVDQSYSGQEINSNILKTIKSVTIRMIQEDEGGAAGSEEDRSHKPETVSEEVIKPVTSSTTESRRDVHHQPETDEECIVSSTAFQTSSAAPPKAGKNILADVKPTGDRGNPHYSSELNREDKEEATKTVQSQVSKEAVAAVIRPVVAPSTGDKGNPYYKKELEEAGKAKESSLDYCEELVLASSVSQTTAAPPSKSPDKKGEGHKEAFSAIIKPATAHITGDKGNPYYAEELLTEAEHKSDSRNTKSGKEVLVEAIKAVVEPTTGNKGNPYYAAELNKEQDKPVDEPIMAATVSDVSAAVPSGSKPEVKSLDQPKQETIAKIIKPAVAPITGDKGNPYYAEELYKGMEISDEASQQKSKAEMVANVIKPVVAPYTGDKGNPYYAEELAQTDKKEGPFPSEENEAAAEVKPSTESERKDTVKSEKGIKKTDIPVQSDKDAKKPDTPVQSDKDAKKPDTPVQSDKDAKKPDTSAQSEKEKLSKGQMDPQTGKKPDSSTSEDPLFGEDNVKETEEAKNSPKGKNRSKRLEDFDEDLKPKPPPLFDDEDDDDDLNWLK